MVSNDLRQDAGYFQTDLKMYGQMKVIAMDEMKRLMEGDINEKKFNICKDKLLSKRLEELKSNVW
jgi:hypothetical protein